METHTQLLQKTLFKKSIFRWLIELQKNSGGKGPVIECVMVLPSRAWDIIKDGDDSTSLVPALLSAVPVHTPTPGAGCAIRWHGQGCRCALPCHKFSAGLFPSVLNQGHPFQTRGLSMSREIHFHGHICMGKIPNHHGSGPRPGSWTVSKT